jgi:hypothetical protein
VEQWRAVVGFEGLYEVSDEGRVKSLARVTANGGRPYRIQERILKPRRDPGGRLFVTLYTQGDEPARLRAHQPRIHVLVLEAFVGPCPPGAETCHFDDNNENNGLENLRWDSHSANEYDKVRNGNDHNAIKTECKHGHAFTPENTVLRPSKNGGFWRQCRECMRIANREAQRARRAARHGGSDFVWGACGQCGKRRDNRQFKLCDECRLRRRLDARARRARERAAVT